MKRIYRTKEDIKRLDIYPVTSLHCFEEALGILGKLSNILPMMMDMDEYRGSRYTNIIAVNDRLKKEVLNSQRLHNLSTSYRCPYPF